jgi:Tfp pilus assembly protein PilZ
MDRRKHPRFIRRLEAKVVADQASFSSISSDLSESGLFIRTNRGFNVDIPIDIELSLPGNRVSFLRGIVRRTVRTPISTMKNGMGIEIIEKDKTFTDFVKSIIGERKDNMAEEQMNPELQMISGVNCEGENKDFGKTIQEKRRHKRLKVEHMEVNSEMPSATDVKIINISESGIFVKADKKLDIGKKHTLKIEYKNKVLFVKAVVVWSLLAEHIKDADGNILPMYIAGMQFTDVLRGEITEIVNLIETDIQGDTNYSLEETFPHLFIASK